MKSTLVYGHILPASARISSTYWREVSLSPDAAAALSRFYCGDERAASLRRVFVKTKRDATQIERIALAETGCFSAVAVAGGGGATTGAIEAELEVWRASADQNVWN